MHKTFRKLLDSATGVSEHVIAVNVDIRGFSAFSKKVESPDVAMFVKKVYPRLIDEYFPSASFFKSTGDGLLITVPYTEVNLDCAAEGTIAACAKVLVDFGSLCSNDPMINFDVPRRVGIGVSRGTACRLVSGNSVLDYSGRVLNLASRLMDLARPTGIVFDGDFGIELLSPGLAKLFNKERVYIKGIAEREGEAIEIYYTKNLTDISPLNMHPLDKIKWNVERDTKTLKEIANFQRFMYPLPSEPIDPREIKVKITHDTLRGGRKHKDFFTAFDFSNFKYELEAGKPRIVVEFDALARRLETNEVKRTWPVSIEIMYPEK